MMQGLVKCWQVVFINTWGHPDYAGKPTVHNAVGLDHSSLGRGE